MYNPAGLRQGLRRAWWMGESHSLIRRQIHFLIATVVPVPAPSVQPSRMRLVVHGPRESVGGSVDPADKLMPRNADGACDPDGTVRVRRYVLEESLQFLNGARTAKAVRGMATLIHEQLHDTSPLSCETRFDGPMMMIEEVTTEMTTRRVLREAFGVELDVTNAAYRNWIVALLFVSAALAERENSVLRSERDFDQALERASVAFKLHPEQITRFDVAAEVFGRLWLTEIGLTPDERLRWMISRALYGVWRGRFYMRTD